MILQRLIEYAERNGLGVDQTYSDKRVYWQIELDGAGKFLGITPRGMGEKKHTGEDIPAPYTSQSLLQGGKISHFILDSSERTLLWHEPDITTGKLAKIKTQNKYFWRLVEECYQVSTQNKTQLKAFLDSRSSVSQIIQALEKQKAKPSQNIVFAVEGVLVSEFPDVRAYWKQQTLPSAVANKSAAAYLDLASGKSISDPQASHGKLKRIPGGQATKSLIANDKDAFKSYGLEDAFNAPVSAANEAKYREALNSLIKTGYFIPPEAVACFWTRTGSQFNPWSTVKEADDADIRTLFDSPTSGNSNASAVVVDEDFYSIILSGVGGRVMVRDWMETTVGSAKESLRQWFTNITIVDQDGLSSKCNHKLYALLYSLTPPKEHKDKNVLDKLPPHLSVQLLRTALKGNAPPAVLLSLAVMRAAMSVFVSKDDDADKFGKEMRRAAIMRLCLLRSQSNQEVNSKMQEKLDQEQKDPAYVCGRLLAMLDRVQYLALGDVGAGVIERMYGAASTTPALVYGRIFRNAQTHLSKLSKEKPGAATNMEKDLEEVTGHLKEWPKTLNLEGQARFALGFYHQKAAYRAKSIENKAAKGEIK